MSKQYRYTLTNMYLFCKINFKCVWHLMKYLFRTQRLYILGTYCIVSIPTIYTIEAEMFFIVIPTLL